MLYADAGRRVTVLWRPLPAWLNVVLGLGTFAGLLWLERQRPLRRWTENPRRRNLRNLALAALSAIAIQLTERPVTQRLTAVVESMFHTSNVALPIALERRLCRVLMTPRLHGIHHSVVEDETDSNWSTIFSWPDYLHRTIRLDVPQHAIQIGAPTVHGDAVRTLPDLIARPFVAAARRVGVSTRGHAPGARNLVA